MGRRRREPAAEVLAALEGRVSRVVYPTSMAVYGDQSEFGDDSVDETSARNPYSLYGYAKLMNEEVAAAYTRNFGLDTRGLRIASVFGHGRVTGRSWPRHPLDLAGCSE